MNKIKNIFKAIRYTLTLLIAQSLLVTPVFAEPEAPVIGGGIESTFDNLFNIANTIVSGITGILSVVMVLIFTWKAFTFARTGDNPSERAKAINGLIFFFIGAACFGAASLITGVFSGMLLGA